MEDDEWRWSGEAVAVGANIGSQIARQLAVLLPPRTTRVSKSTSEKSMPLVVSPETSPPMLSAEWSEELARATTALTDWPKRTVS